MSDVKTLETKRNREILFRIRLDRGKKKLSYRVLERYLTEEIRICNLFLSLRR